MQQSYITPTAAQELSIDDCIAEDLKPRYEKTIRQVLGINAELVKRGIKPKHIDPTAKQPSYQYKPY